jgi:hypothetical protein
MKQKLKFASSFLVAGLFLFMAYGSGGSASAEKVDIKSEQDCKSYVLGKWKDNKTYSGMVVYYRLEITNSQIKCWKKADATMAGAGSDEWSDTPNEVVNYNIGTLQTDSKGNKFRLLGKIEYGDVFISSGQKDDMGSLTVGNTEFDYNSDYLYPTKGWELK